MDVDVDVDVGRWEIGGGGVDVLHEEDFADDDCGVLLQRQTTVSQFFQLDRLVVEGGKTVCDSIHCRMLEGCMG